MPPDLPWDLEGLTFKVADDLRSTSRLSHLGEIFSGIGVSRLIAEVVVDEHDMPDHPATILDITGGVGSTVIATAERFLQLGGELNRVDSIDINEHAIQASRTLGQSVNLPFIAHMSNSLIEDPVPDVDYDYVVAVPPFGLSWSLGSDMIEMNDRLVRPLPPAQDATFLFIQRAIAKLRSPDEGGGRAAILTSMKPLIGRSKGEEAARRWLLDQELLESIVYLPGGLHTNTSIPSAILVFSNRRASDTIRLVNATHLFEVGTHGESDEPSTRLTSGHIARISGELRSNKRTSHAVDVTASDLTYATWSIEKPGSGGSPVAVELSASREASEAEVTSMIESDGVVATKKDVRTQLSVPSDINPIKRAHEGRLDVATTRYLFDLALHAPSNDPPLCDHEWIWVPSTANSRVAAGQKTTKNGWHVCIDQDQALPSYLASVMTSMIGRDERMLHAGAIIPNIRRSELMAFRIPLVDLEHQRMAIAVDARIASYQESLADMSSSLWKKPSDAFTVEAAVKELVPEDSHERWLDSLPYPLSTALWQALAVASTKARHDQILDFFEATAEYLATLHLSAQLQPLLDSPDETAGFLRSLRDDHSIDLTYAAFGDWVEIVGALSRRVRQTLELAGDDADLMRARIYEGYGTDTDSFARLASKDVTAILRLASHYRNNRTAHTGRVTDAEAKRWLKDLDDLLLRLRIAVGTSLAGHVLARPVNSVQRSGRWTHTVQLLTGSKLPFRTADVELDHPLDADDLYLLHAGLPTAVRLIRFVRIVVPSDPSATDCFFYSRKGDGGYLKYVSYNAVNESEALFDVDIPVLSALSDSG